MIIYMINNIYNLKEAFFQSSVTDTSPLQYKLVDKQCWVDDDPIAITDLFLDLRIGTPQAISSANRSSSVIITVPANLVMQSNQVGNLTYTDLERYNEWALSIAIQYGFDTIGYQAYWALFFGKYATNYNNVTYSYDKYGRPPNSTCLPFGDGWINHVYTVEPITTPTETSTTTTTPTETSTSTTTTTPTETSTTTTTPTETSTTTTTPTETSTSTTTPTETSTTTPTETSSSSTPTETSTTTSTPTETSTTSSSTAVETSTSSAVLTSSALLTTSSVGISLIAPSEISIDPSILLKVDLNLYEGLSKFLKTFDKNIDYETSVIDTILYVTVKSNMSTSSIITERFEIETSTSTSRPITKVIIILTERKDLVDLILKWKVETPITTSSKLGTNAIIALSIIIFLLIVVIGFIIRRYKVKNIAIVV